jgi:hypothetical protein
MCKHETQIIGPKLIRQMSIATQARCKYLVLNRFLNVEMNFSVCIVVCAYLCVSALDCVCVSVSVSVSLSACVCVPLYVCLIVCRCLCVKTARCCSTLIAT